MQFSDNFSSLNWENKPEVIFDIAKIKLAKYLKLPPVAEYQVHRWKYSEIKTTGLKSSFSLKQHPNVILCGDAFSDTSGVSGAYQSSINAVSEFKKIAS